MKRPMIYVAGPYRDARGAYYVARNIDAAREVGMRLLREGFHVAIPHTMTGMCDGAVPDEVFLENATALLERCDAVVVVDGWAASEGTRAEMWRARELGIPVFTVSGGFSEPDWLEWNEDRAPGRSGMRLMEWAAQWLARSSIQAIEAAE